MMLAEFLVEVRQQILRLLCERAASEDSLRERLPELLDDLITSLRMGRAEPPRLDGEPELGLRAFNRLRRTIFDVIQARAIQPPLSELRIISEWLGAGIAEAAEQSAARARRLMAVLDAIPDHVVLVRRHGGLIYANRATLDSVGAATGIPTDQILGHDGRELGMPTDFMDQFERERDQAVATGQPVRSETLFPTPEGGRWREHTISPVYCREKVDAVAIVSRDIHDRKLAQNRLRLLSKLSTLVEADRYEDVLGAMARVSIPELADWCIVDVVEGNTIRRAQVAHRDPGQAELAAAILRYPLSTQYRERYGKELLAGRSVLVPELTPEKLRDICPNEEYYQLVLPIGACSLMAVPSVVQGETVAITTFAATCGTRRYGPDALAVAEELARRAAHVIENARLHQRISESNERFRVALASSQIAVFEQDAELRYRWYYNPAFRSAEQVIGKTHEELFPREEADRLTAIKRRVLETGESAREEVHLSINGEKRAYESVIDPLRDRSGAIVGVIGAATDITTAKRAREELAQALEIREQLMGILGHDLRNPLSAIALSATRLLQDDGLSEQARSLLERVDRAARRMAEMIRTLLDVTETRSKGTLQLSVAATDFHEVCRRVVEELLAAHPDRVIDLSLSGNGRGQWDGARLAQVVSNLVGNALTHGANGEPVRIMVGSDAAGVVLKVHNDGPTIPMPTIPTLFEPFRRGPNNNASQGLGLGLYIVRQIVLAHKGTIAVASTPEDGTTFTIHLPRNQQ